LGDLCSANIAYRSENERGFLKSCREPPNAYLSGGDAMIEADG
jgi:hypothetical protein